MARDEIHDEILNDVYREYLRVKHTGEKIDALYEGVKKIFLKLNWYKNNTEKLKEKSEIELRELENLLDRFYYQDEGFKEKMLFEARAYILELTGE